MSNAFGVEHEISKLTKPQETHNRRVNTAAGGAVGAVYLGGPAAVGAQYGGYAAGIKATKMHRAANNGPTPDKKYAGNPHYSKYRKAQNLADRASTPGEKTAAQGMADKLSAKHGPFVTPKAKKLGTGYKVLRRVQRLSNPKVAVPVGFGVAGGIGAGVANAASRHGEKIRSAKKKS